MKNIINKLIALSVFLTVVVLVLLFSLYYKDSKLLDDYHEHMAAEQLFINDTKKDDDFQLAPCTDPNQKESEFTWEGDLNPDYNIPPTGVSTSYYGLSEDDLNLLYAVVMQEGGPTFESAEAVTSTIVNRINNPKKWGWAGNTIIDQITYPQQYCYSLDDYWVKYLNGNVPDTVKWGVLSVLEYGPSHHYDCFRGYYLEGCEQISDNWYFVG